MRDGARSYSKMLFLLWGNFGTLKIIIKEIPSV